MVLAPSLERTCFFIRPGGAALWDAVTVKTSARGRHPDGLGSWLYVASPTPGGSNLFNLRDDIVINEIMYHHHPIDPAPAVERVDVVLPMSGSWRFDDSGTPPAQGWFAADYDDSYWKTGDGLFTFNAASLPGTLKTTLAGGRSAYYFRARFNVSEVSSNLSLALRLAVDDGAVFYLNGHEIHRQNMPPGPIDYATPAVTPVTEAELTGPIRFPAQYLTPGTNVLAVEVHQQAAVTVSSGVVLNGGGLSLVEEGPVNGAVPNNLSRQPGSAPFVIDSLAGYAIHNFPGLTDGVYGNGKSWIGNPGYAGVRFGGLSTISSIAFGRDNSGLYADRTFGLYTLQFTRVTNPGTTTGQTGNADSGWATIGTLNYQGAGTGLFAHPSWRHRFTFAPVQATGIRLLVPGTGIANGTCIDELEVNPPDSLGDVAFGAELSLITTLSPAIQFSKSTEQWVELFNHGPNTVDLSGWNLDGAVDYSFNANTSIPGHGYLVVANDTNTLQSKWPEVATRIVGNMSGRLGGGEKVTLKDAAGNPVNVITVHEGGWSDGGGSSLELIDPHGDTENSGAWADSDETERIDWQNVSYRMVAGQRNGSSCWNEFRIGMLDDGEALIDDVKVIRDPNGARQNMIQDGDFEGATAAAHWRMLGSHARSRIIAEPRNPTNHVLKVSASSAARTSHNHIETTFAGNAPLVD